MRKDSFGRKGFTLIELIITVAVFAIMTGGVALALSRFLASSHLDDNAGQLVHVLRKAQGNSMMRIKDSQWGVYLDDDSGGLDQEFTFFKGASYATRDTGYDDLYELPDILSFENISINGGGSEVVFTKVNGETSDYGSFDIKDDITTYTITINAFGQIEIN